MWVRAFLPVGDVPKLNQRGKTTAEIQILILAWLWHLPHGWIGEAPAASQWLSPSLGMVALPGRDPGLKERGSFPAGSP